MENATKALLIAAAVLIVIVLIALGVSLLNAGGDTSKQVEGISGEISDVTGLKTEDIVDDLLSMSGNEIIIGLAKKSENVYEILKTTKISVAESKKWKDIKGRKFDFIYENLVSGEICINTYTPGYENMVAVKIKRKKDTNPVEPFLYVVKKEGNRQIYLDDIEIGKGMANVEWEHDITIGNCYIFVLGENVYK